jgi:hypothetical protein
LVHEHLTGGHHSSIRIKQQAAPLEIAANFLERMTKRMLTQLNAHPIQRCISPALYAVRSTYSL